MRCWTQIQSCAFKQRRMHALRPSLQCHARFVLRPRLLQVRSQHTDGPHKYYFQNPDQAPVPDPAPYVQPPPVQPLPTPIPPVQPNVATTGQSRGYRAFKSVSWAILFSIIGLGAGAGLITWEYIQPPFAPGSEEEKELLQEIDEALDTHPLVDDLRQQGWKEENFHAEKVHRLYYDRDTDAEFREKLAGLDLVQEKLSGIQGMSLKWFQHPTDQFSILVCFLGFGVEGWPDTIHGGIIATLFEEAMMKHTNQLHPDLLHLYPSHISIDFKKPVRPGEIYAILLSPPGPKEIDESDLEVGRNPRVYKRYAQTALFLSIEAAPRVGTSYDASTRTATHEIGLSEPGSADATTFIHAMAVADIAIHPPASAMEASQAEAARLEVEAGTDRRD